VRGCTSRLLQSFGNFQQPVFFFGNFAPIAGFNRAGQQEELFDYGKEMFGHGIGDVRIRVWNGSALERRHRYG